MVAVTDLKAAVAHHCTPGRAVGVLALAAVAVEVTGVTLLPSPRDVDDFARVLYARLRDADALHLDVLLVVLPPPGGLGDAVRDRIRRAAAR
jgi:L-threonylcarbamoyladenylate synthase